MGQGLHTKIRQVVADYLGIDQETIQVTATRTDKVPNTSPTAASSGSDLNGMAALTAARKIRKRLEVFLREIYQTSADVRFSRGMVRVGGNEISFSELARKAWFARVPLSATGHYATPDIGWDPRQVRVVHSIILPTGCSNRGGDRYPDWRPKVLRVDILHDVGKSLIQPSI